MTMNEKGIDTTIMLEYFFKYDMLIFVLGICYVTILFEFMLIILCNIFVNFLNVTNK